MRNFYLNSILKDVSSRILLVCILSLGLISLSYGATINVPADQPTIQAAVSAATAGDIISVSPGTYNENVIIDKSLTLVSTGGSGVTSIVGSDNGTLGTIYINPGVSNVTIGASGQGFTIVGFDNDNGGIEAAAVYFPAVPLASNNITIQYNVIEAKGEHGLLSNYNSSIDNIVIDNNSFTGQTFAGANPDGIGFATQFNAVNNVPRQLVTLGGGEGVTNSMNVTFTNNQILGTAGGISTDDGVSEQGNTLVTIDVLGATISGNTFSGTTTRFGSSLRVRGGSTDVFSNVFNSGGLSVANNHVYGGNGSAFTGATNSPTLNDVGLNNTYDKGSYISNTTSQFYIDLHPQTSYARLTASGSGDEIKVFPSTYQTVGQINITDDVEFIGLGANKSMTVFTTDQNTGTSGDSRGWFLVQDDTELSMSNLTLDGSGYLIWQAVRHKGYGTFDNVHFTEIKYQVSGSPYSGVAIAAFGVAPLANVDVLNSMFTEIGRIGVLYFGTGITGSTFDNNMYTGKGVGDWLDYALDISAGAIVNVTNNTITNNKGTASSDGSKSAGILVSTFFGPGTTAVIFGNTINDNTCGVTVGFNGLDASIATINNNNITGNTLFGVNTTNALVDATLNWWGDASGPSGNGPGSGDAVSDSVIFCPWLNAPVGFGSPVPASCVLNAICQDDTIVCSTDMNGTVSASGSAGLPPYTYQWDASAGSVTTSQASGLGVGSYSVTITDDLGATATCTATIIDIDNVFPFATCIQNAAVGLDPVSGTVTVPVSLVDNGSSDNCGIDTIFLDKNFFTCADVGINNIELTVRDAAGNENFCTTVIDIQDKIDPKMVCQNSNLKLDATGNAMLMASMVDGGSSDACGIDTLIVSPSKYTCADLGANMVVLKGIDPSGNSDTCHAMVTVMDNLAPNALCIDSICVFLDDTGSATATGMMINNGSTDNCMIASMTLDSTSFDCSEQGANAVVLTVTDQSGNSDTCHATIWVKDTIPPVAVCADLTVYLDAAGVYNYSGLVWSQMFAFSTDNCGLFGTFSYGGLATCADLGTNTFVLRIRDNSAPWPFGNTDTCHYKLTVIDTLAPTPVCQDIDVILDASGNASIMASAVDNGSSDNCTIDTITVTPNAFSCSDVVTTTAFTTSATAGTQPYTGPLGNDFDVVDPNGVLITELGAFDDMQDGIKGAPNGYIRVAIFDYGTNAIVPGLDVNIAGAGDPLSGGFRMRSVSPVLLPVGNYTVVAQGFNTNERNGNINTGSPAASFNGSGRLALGPGSGYGGSFTNMSSSVSPSGYFLAGSFSYKTNSVEVVLEVTDASGNSDTCTATVTVKDTTPPVAACQDLTVVLDASGGGMVSPSMVDAGSSDNCPISLALDTNQFTCADVGLNTVILSVYDACGNSDTCHATITVEDNMDPDAQCQDLTVYLDASGNASITTMMVDNGSSDICGIDTMTLSNSTFACADTGANDVVLTVTDVNGNSDTCHSTVTVLDTVPPDAQCMNATIYLDSNGEAQLKTSDINNGSSDACGIASMSLDSTSFNCSETGENPVVLTVTDVNGNSDTCLAKVLVLDTLVPAALCQSFTVVLDAAGNAIAAASSGNAGSTDNCGGPLTLILATSSYTCADLGINDNKLYVYDNSGNVDSCDLSVTVIDTTDPVAICKDIKAYLDVTGTVIVPASDVDNGSSDACGPLALSLSPDSFVCSDVGMNTVILTASDGSGNSDSDTCTVIVADTVAPDAQCKDIIVSLDASGNATITATDVNNGSSDACGIASLAIDNTSFTCADTGANTVTLTVTDVNSNSDTCTSTVTVVDDRAPTPICSFGISVGLDGTGTAFVPASAIDNGSFDNCGICDITLSPQNFTCADVGTNVVMLTVKDCAGNQALCTTIVQVQDKFPPKAVCKDITIQLDAAGQASITGLDIDGGSSDACGIVSYTASPNAFDCSDLGTNTSTLTVTDAHGNSHQCDATVTVADTISPKAVCKDISVDLDATGNITIAGNAVDNGSSDNCSIASYSTSPNMFTCADTGMNTVTMTVTDPAGNTDTCSATVTVSDNTAPNTVCKDITVSLDTNGNATVSGMMLNDGSTDNCGIASMAAAPGSYTCADTGANTIVLTTTDAAGNSSTDTCTVTIIDDMSPDAVCMDITVYLDGSGNATASGAMLDGGSTDNCGVASLSASPAMFTCADTGANTVVLTVTDAAGNASTDTCTVTVADTLAPNAMCTNITIVLDSLGNDTITAAMLDGGSTDNCTDVSLSAAQTAFSCADVGSNSITLTVTDAAGNSSTCEATVTVEDNTDPVAVCQDITVSLGSNGTVQIQGSDIDGGSSDACGVILPSCGDLLISGVIDGPLSGGIPKAVEIYVVNDIADLSAYGFGSANNGGGSDGQEFTFPAVSATAGQYIYISSSGASAEAAFTTYFGFPADYSSFASSINGDDALELFKNGSVIDIYGDINVIGDFEVWDYSDGWAYRKSHTGPDGTVFDSTAWIYSGRDAIDGETSNATASSQMPIGTYAKAPFNCTFTCADTGDNTVVMTVADPSGNTDVCTATVTVVNSIAPTALCVSSLTVALNSSGMASITPADIDSGSLDPCGIDSLEVTPNMFDCSDTGTILVTLTATDGSGNSSSCTSLVTVVDNAPPTALCQSLTIQLDSMGNASVTAAQVAGSSTDNCGIDTIILSKSDFTCADVGSDTITATITDAAGNSSTCTAIITVEDTVPPTAVCNSITVVLDPVTGMASITPSDVDGGSADDCGIMSRSTSDSTFNCGDLGNQTVTLTVTDANSNSATCNATVTVADTVAPNPVCTNVSMKLGANGQVTVSPFDIDNGSTDACGIVSLTLSQSTFTCADTGTTTVTLTLMDPAGNTSSCTGDVTISDNTPPNPVCVKAISVTLSPSGSVSLPANVVDNGTFDNCDDFTLKLVPSTFTCSDIGINNVTLTATDASGNSAFCTTTIEVQENIPPVAVCMDTTVQLDSSGNTSITASQVDGGSTDNCGIDTLIADVTSFDCSDVGSNTVVLTVIDKSGNVSTCNATVTIEDNVAPIAVCQTDTIYLDASGNQTADAANLDGGSTDACGVDTLTIAEGDAYTCADLGNNTVTLVVTDVNGNSDSCSAVLTVIDTVPPVAVCQDISIQLDASGNATISASEVDSASTDACGVAGLSVTPSAFNCSNVGANTVTLTVTDGSGNSSNCSATVTVSDTVAPVAKCKNVTLNLNASGTATLAATAVNNASTDACGPLSFSLDNNSFTCANVGSNTVTLTVTDANGNSSTCTANVLVKDVTPPIALCNNVTLQLDSNGNTSTTVAALNGGSTDACGILSVTASKTTFNCSNLGNNSVILTVKDVNNNTAVCASTVTVQDPIAPTVTCQNVNIYLNSFGFFQIDPDTLVATSDDNCAVTNVSLNQPFVSCANVGNVNITVTVFDASGNSASCLSTVSVFDTIAPTPNCDTTFKTLGANGIVIIDVEDVDLFSFDACGLVSRVIDADTFSCADIGPNLVNLTLMDPSGNTSTCTGTIIVQDNTSPTISCKNLNVNLDSNGVFVFDPLTLVNSSSDNCGIDTITASPAAVTCANVGAPASITVTATDESGNSKSCISTVNASDVTPPDAVCLDIDVYLDDNGMATIAVGDVDGGTSDACGLLNVAIETTMFDCSDVGANPVNLFATDVNGNNSSCVATVTIIDSTAPEAICKDITVALNNDGIAVVVASSIDNGSNDACGLDTTSAVFSISQDTFTCGDIGTVTATLTVTDINGNTSTCTSTITVQDNINPVAVCIQGLGVGLDTGLVIIDPSQIDAGSFDNCSSTADSSLTLTLIPNMFSCENLGLNTVVLVATDASGNNQACITTIEVQDNFNVCPPPPATCFAPDNAATTNVSFTTATLSYNASAGATSYIIEGGVQGGTYIQLAFNGTSLNAGNLGQGTTYEWRVYSVCDDPNAPENQVGDTSAPSPWVTFTTLSCDAPTGLNTNVTSSTTATLTWNAVPGALGYRVIGGQQGSPNLVSVDLNGNGNTSLNAGGLQSGTSYQWVVYAICSVNPSIISPQSAVQTFSTPTSTAKADRSTEDIISMTIYPNPNDGQFIIEMFNFGEETKVEIYDLIGQLIMTEESAQEKIEIDMSSQERGTYIIRVTSGDETISHRVVIQ
ncbi:MAG: T9SS type A sorting domain-containing protein [Bacteroidia bacterium]|nr:T9SS type A sorting domain-containing protein [Bacteroidia bacterium]